VVLAGRSLRRSRGRSRSSDGGNGSRLTLALDFKGRGVGTLLVPLVIRRQARKQLPRNAQRLKEVLERQT
jgi:hypothetical protein